MADVISGSFAIHNSETGKNLRPYSANTSDGTDIVLYPHNWWKCLTWEFIHVEGTSYQLKNLYTGKTFEPVSEAEDGVALWQQPLDGESSQYWEFLKQDDETYLIRLQDTELFITLSSEETDSPIILKSKQDGSTQKWILKEQYPPH